MRIGYNTWSMATVPYEVFVPKLAEIGYTAIAVSVIPGYTIGGRHVDNAADLAKLTRDDRRRLKEAFEERGLELASVVGNQSLMEPDEAKSAAYLQRLRDTIDFCVEVAPRDQPIPTMNTGAAGRTDEFESKKQLLVDRLGALTDHARQRGVVICIEPHVGGAIDTPERSEWLVRTVDDDHCQLDFDVSHFEVAGFPLEESVPRLAPLAGAVEIKDQNWRYADEPMRDGWRIEGNGLGRTTAPDGRALEFQFLLGGEGDFDLPTYLRLMQELGYRGAIGFEASVQCQARPGYDALASAARTYRWMADGWRQAGVPLT